MFGKLLIANRGEIARRIIRTSQRLGIATVAVHSEADRGEPHVREADESVCIGPAPSAQSYLDIDAILAAAEHAGADAVHPGYGFLAENATFAERCVAAGLVFVGPDAETIRLMGDKSAAKRHLADAGVPVIPGVDEVTEEDDLRALAEEVGLPLLVKAISGGGGKGMRRVEDPDDLEEAVAAVRREASAAFGDDRIMLERVVQRPRHVEIQVFGDTHGEVVHLFERECSIQRRHQKIVEESPSPALDGELRARMCEAAVTAASSVDYVGAGTVEMLLSDVTREFHFLEMNTRLQVEHPVTELCTGIDLVEWQLRVAAGEPLPLTQEEITTSGHAIETRLYAEDPANGFLPQSGDVLVFDAPQGPATRVDAGVVSGSVVSPHYDPMIAKLVTHGPDRDSARRTMSQLLRETTVLGLTTNIEHLIDVVEHPAFAEGDLHTSFLDENLPDWERRPVPLATIGVVTGALLGLVDHVARSTDPDPWEQLGPWRLGDTGGWTLRLRAGEDEHDVTTRGRRDRLRLTINGDEHDVYLRSSPARTEVEIDGERHEGRVAVIPPDAPRIDVVQAVWVHTAGVTRRLEVVPPTRHRSGGLAAAGAALTAPMPGTVAAVNVAEGDHVDAGTTLIVVEAMKMEHPVKAPAPGTVSALHVETGQAVDAESPLVELEADDDPQGD